ncbi:MAG: hypothetical protein PVS2B2_08520 [Candidatus Acidiferrum sp.]
MRGCSASADRGKKSNFIARAERSGPGDEFLIARSNQGATKFLEFGIAAGDAEEKIFDGGSLGQLGGFLRAAEKLLDLAEEKNVYANGLGDGWHKGIVT